MVKVNFVWRNFIVALECCAEEVLPRVLFELLEVDRTIKSVRFAYGTTIAIEHFNGTVDLLDANISGKRGRKSRR